MYAMFMLKFDEIVSGLPECFQKIKTLWIFAFLWKLFPEFSETESIIHDSIHSFIRFLIRHPFPSLRADSKKQNSSFEIVFISSDDSEKEMLAYIKKAKMPWPAIKYEEIDKLEFLKKAGGRGVPCISTPLLGKAYSSAESENILYFSALLGMTPVMLAALWISPDILPLSLCTVLSLPV